MTDPKAIAASLTEAQRAMLNKQIANWPNVMKGAAQGNPFATLCQHCMGRHRPPNDDLCPHLSLKGKTARFAILQEQRHD